MHINWGVHLRAGVLGCRPKGGYLRGMHINRGGVHPRGLQFEGGFLRGDILHAPFTLPIFHVKTKTGKNTKPPFSMQNRVKLTGLLMYGIVYRIGLYLLTLLILKLD